MRILLKNCVALLYENNDFKIVHNVNIVIENDYILDITKNDHILNVDEVIDMTNKLVMPGLIDAHGHSPMTLFRGVGAGLPLSEWLNDVIFPLELKLTNEAIRAGIRLAQLEMISGGITQYAEMYDRPYVEICEVATSGIKCNICRVGLAFNENDEPKDILRYHETLDLVRICRGFLQNNQEMLNEIHVERLPENVSEAIQNKRIIPELCFHSEYLTSAKFVKAISEENKTLAAPIQIHVSETKKEHEECITRRGVTPTKYFYQNGVLNGKINFAHCCYVTDDDLKIMKDTNTTLVFNPSSNMKLASGFAPIVKALRLGVNVAIGTDGCASNDNLDMFEEMHIGMLTQNGFNLDASALKPSDLIKMATVNGAKALGRLDTGKIEVGYKADIIALDLSKPHLNPHNDLLDLVVNSASASDVCFTMVDGKILYQDGNYFTLNKDEIIKEANIQSELLLKH